MLAPLVRAVTAAALGAITCGSDLDANGTVAFGDVLQVLAAWGAAGDGADLDGSGAVGFEDLLIVLADWGPCVADGAAPFSGAAAEMPTDGDWARAGIELSGAALSAAVRMDRNWSVVALVRPRDLARFDPNPTILAGNSSGGTPVFRVALRRGDPAGIDVQVNAAGASETMLVPAHATAGEPWRSEWALIWLSWHMLPTSRMMAGLRTERVDEESVLSGFVGGVFPPIDTLVVGNAAAGADGVALTWGPLWFRSRTMTAADADAFWNAAAPGSAAQVAPPTWSGLVDFVDAGNDALLGMFYARSSAAGYQQGGSVQPASLVMTLDPDGARPKADTFASDIEALSMGVSGAWQYRDMLGAAVGAEPAGYFGADATPFFGIRCPSDAEAGPNWTRPERSPRWREIVTKTPARRYRVIVGPGNSRGVREEGTLDDAGFPIRENIGSAFISAARETVVGTMGPPMLADTWSESDASYFWRGGFGGVRGALGAPLALANMTELDARRMLGRFGTGSVDAVQFGLGTNVLGGTGVWIPDGATYRLALRPIAGTRFDDPAQPVTIEAVVLRLPGFGAVAYRTVRVADGADPEPDILAGPGTSGVADASMPAKYAAVVPPGAAWLSGRTLALPTVAVAALGEAGVAPGDVVVVAGGPDRWATGRVESVTGAVTAVVTFDRDWPVPLRPAVGDVLLFSAWDLQTITIEGVPSATAEKPYRGIDLTADGAPCLILWRAGFRSDADGVVPTDICGLSGDGYAEQFDDRDGGYDVTGGVAWVAAARPDAVLLVTTHQQSAPSSLDVARERMDASWPGIRYAIAIDPRSTGDGGWSAEAMDVARPGVPAVSVRRRHADLWEQAALGERADVSHPSAWGMKAFGLELFQHLRAAALPE